MIDYPLTPFEERFAKTMLQSERSHVNKALAQVVASLDPEGSFSENQRQGSARFSPDLFFTKWFGNPRSCKLFLFKKNRKVTDIQVAELLSLIQLHTLVCANHTRAKIDFLSRTDFCKAIESIVAVFERDDANPFETYKAVAKRYSDLVQHAAVIENFCGSSVVYIPPFLELRMERICGESGYIHSCGNLVFIRNAYSTTDTDFFNALDEYLPRDGTKKLFTAYTHEDFTEFDRAQKDDLKYGLDDIKFYLDKVYMGTKRLATVVQEMRIRFKDRLVFPEPGDYRITHEAALDIPDLNKTSSLWLIVDRNIDQRGRQPGDRRYYICYDQEHLNENPFHIFDENKPGWIDHTTIPHTLLGAMLNITRPYWRDPKVVICDPFVGSGTSWLEGLKFPNASFMMSDLSEFSPLVTRDNLELLSLASSSLKDYKKLLGGLADELRVSPPKRVSTSLEQYDDAMELYNSIGFDDTDGLNLSHAVAEQAEKKPLEVRLIFYLILRTVRRYTAALDRDARSWKILLSNEAAVLSSQFERLIKLRSSEEVGTSDGNGFTVYSGSYSTACSINSARLRELRQEWSLHQPVTIQDARYLKAHPESCDVIITDPPYGFNTREEIESLAELYSEMIEIMILALRPGGQLVFAVPEWSHTGRQLAPFTQRNFIAHQVLVTAHKCGRHVVATGTQIPKTYVPVSAPYYWESEKALRRAILHFRLAPSSVGIDAGTLANELLYKKSDI